MLIRQETEENIDAVYSVVKTAFASAAHSDGNEHDLVAALRKSNAFVPELSLVILGLRAFLPICLAQFTVGRIILLFCRTKKRGSISTAPLGIKRYA